MNAKPWEGTCPLWYRNSPAFIFQRWPPQYSPPPRPSRDLPSLPSIKSLRLLPLSLSRTLWLPWLVVYGKYDRRDARWPPGLVIKGRTASAPLSFLGCLPLGPAAVLWRSPGHTEARMERDRGWASSWLHSHVRSRSTCSSPVNWHRVQQHWAFSHNPRVMSKMNDCCHLQPLSFGVVRRLSDQNKWGRPWIRRQLRGGAGPWGFYTPLQILCL